MDDAHRLAPEIEANESAGPAASSAGKRSLAVLILAGILIAAWQAYQGLRPKHLDDRFRLLASSGKHYEERFVYFYHYLGLFPVATEKEDLVYSRAGAREVLAKHGETLVMEVGTTIRGGELGAMFLYLPDVLLRGSIEEPSLRLCHALVFVLALEALFVAFWWAGRVSLGIVLVALLGSNPFQLHEAYARENVFSWQISTALLLLALHVPLLGFRRPARGAVWLLPLVSGVLIGSVRHVRPEANILLACALFAYAVAPGLRWWSRAALAGLLMVCYVGVARGWQGWFEHKFQQARRAVVAAGGHPYDGPRVVDHVAWHSIWCGLGDFDTKYGYEWHDVRATAYARPVLERKYGLTLPEWDGKTRVYHGSYWDRAGKYYKKPYESPHYGEVLRDKVLHDITHDPLWYLGILARRAWRILSVTTPVRLAARRRWVTLPMHGVVLLPVLAVLVWKRRRPLVRLLCFTLPLSLTPLLVYSGRGTTYYAIYHLIMAAIVYLWAARAAVRFLRGRRPLGMASEGRGD